MAQSEAHTQVWFCQECVNWQAENRAGSNVHGFGLATQCCFSGSNNSISFFQKIYLHKHFRWSLHLGYWLVLGYPLSNKLSYVCDPQTWICITYQHHLRHLVENIASPVPLLRFSIRRSETGTRYMCVHLSHLLTKVQESLCSHSIEQQLRATGHIPIYPPCSLLLWFFKGFRPHFLRA